MSENRSSNLFVLYHHAASHFSADLFQIGMGFPKVWTIMIPCRMLLGLLEAGFFPGCVYLISMSPNQILLTTMLMAY